MMDGMDPHQRRECGSKRAAQPLARAQHQDGLPVAHYRSLGTIHLKPSGGEGEAPAAALSEMLSAIGRSAASVDA